MATFVLVHGAWQTSATWDPLLPYIRSRGNTVVTPKLTGAGAGQLTAETSLAMHIEDVASAVQGLAPPVILAGHGYSGMVISGVAERLAGKLDSLIYIDAFVPEDGQSAIEQMPAALAASLRSMAVDGWRLPASEELLDLWGLAPGGAARAFVRSCWCDFSLRCFSEPIPLPARRRSGVPARYLASTASGHAAREVFAPLEEKARAGGWKVFAIPTGHASYAEHPAEVAAAMMAP